MARKVKVSKNNEQAAKLVALQIDERNKSSPRKSNFYALEQIPMEERLNEQSGILKRRSECLKIWILKGIIAKLVLIVLNLFVTIIRALLKPSFPIERTVSIFN